MTRGWVSARDSKEVARMINKIPALTAQSPAFGMPIYGQTSVEHIAVPATTGVQVSTCARTRFGGTGLTTKDDFPGTSAWRPPTC
jgi:hypothetical protein